MQDSVYPGDADGHDGDIESSRDHPDAAAKRGDFLRLGPHALGKDQDRPPSRNQLADVGQRVPRPRLALRDRERVEEARREVVVQRVRDPLPPRVFGRIEMRFEELFEHRWCEASAPATRQRRQDDRDIHVALMVRSEHHGSFQVRQVLETLDPQMREHAREGNDPRGL